MRLLAPCPAPDPMHAPVALPPAPGDLPPLPLLPHPLDTMELADVPQALPVAPPGPPLRVPVTIGICKLCKKVYRPEVGAPSSYLADLWTIFREI